MPNENETAQTNDVETQDQVVESQASEPAPAEPAQQQSQPAKEPEPAPAEPAKAKQSDEENRRFAQQRREREQKEAVEAAKRAGRVEAIIELTNGKNPYTDEPMKDAEDVAIYEAMKDIADNGGDPLKDYASYQKKRAAEKATAEKESAERARKANEDIANFQTQYPDVDLQALSGDADFNYFAAGHLGKEPLVDVYARYMAFRNAVAGKARDEFKDEQSKIAARDAAAVGSLGSAEQAESEFYTKEQMDKMSPSEMEKNWEKVQASVKRLPI